MIKLYENKEAAAVHFEKVFPLIKKRTTNILNSGIRKNKAIIPISGVFRNFLEDLKNKETLRKIILGSPASLRAIFSSVDDQFPDIFVPGSDQNQVIKNIFVSHCYEKMDKLEFIQSINKDTCLYCNRNYIYSLTKSGLIKPPIDHFFPKNIYPLFGVSFYNLIPSCETCNGFGAKGENDPLAEDLISPYELEGSEFLFTYELDSIEFLNPLSQEIGLKIKLQQKVDGNTKVFKLDQLYNRHGDHVREMLFKSKVEYSQTYRQYLKQFKKFKISDNEIDRMILGNYTTADEMHKRPLAKLYADIGRELGLIK